MTGGGGGLGLTQGEALAQAGATVYALDVHGSPPEQFARTEARQPNMHYRTADVRSPTMLAHTMRDITQRHGRLDGLIAGAGVLAEHAALDYTRDDFARILDVNVTGAFLSAQAAAREMVRCRSPGSIVLIASMSGLIANRVFPSPFLSLPVPPPLPFSYHSAFPLPWRNSKGLRGRMGRTCTWQRTTRPRVPCIRWHAAWLPSGVWPMASASTRSRPATSSPTWSEACLRGTRSAATNGAAKT